MRGVKLQAPFYDILPPTTAVTDYAIGLEICQLTDSFSLMLRWQYFSNSQLKLNQAYLL